MAHKNRTFKVTTRQLSSYSPNSIIHKNEYTGEYACEKSTSLCLSNPLPASLVENTKDWFIEIISDIDINKKLNDLLVLSTDNASDVYGKHNALIALFREHLKNDAAKEARYKSSGGHTCG